ncbi:MAG: TIGR04376 family protein [Cyanobacteria bacterium QH_8_48_120]|nr:MAG: TIGR04376 family protein [Cyanobacteria bacterium QH_1_48_107]PSO57017.1 MAG: TIGR04376 family protein [Cyanobacteria bacterium QH_7_48_89]PSO58275.1 MAG: TIGR04376 family protein [Cyanobacteria bacterium QH_10_48_56]PSO65490.1 MAG: TIGR04376 family protein [Cyanobacteria bacterium QH_6_48_35]PSO67942.1 MAG: TIGR04376 family protein [Cyanobacteria bacterium QS_1_48_34]PSO72900.1 MAG: TIGR04376 family protein [Cyanobacteria bacterium QH_8_48_120]PSO78549.1 MAG: TIGR04376 family protein
MSIFDDLNRFLETRLEEFLRSHPHLELQALEEQLREQQEDTRRLIADLQGQQKRLKDEILSIAKDIQRWHARIDKARAANRPDLAEAAQEKEASLLRLGNQRWGQMEGLKKRIAQSQDLLNQIQQRRQEVKAKAANTKSSQSQTPSKSGWEKSGWNQRSNYSNSSSVADPLEEKFQRWETENELEQMKRNQSR